MQKRMCDIGRADEKKCWGLWWRGRHGETQIVPLPNLPGSLRSDPRRVEEVRPSVEAVSETVSNRPTPQSVPLKAVSGCVRNGRSTCARRTPPQERQTWPGPPSAPPPELDEEGSQRWQIAVAVECTGTCSHQVTGELPDEKRTYSGWRFGAFLAQPRRWCDQHLVSLRRFHVMKEDDKSLRYSKRSEA